MTVRSVVKRLPGVRRMLALRSRERQRAALRSEARLLWSGMSKDPSEVSEGSVRRGLLVTSHVIEKGLSHEDFRPRFGSANVGQLVERLEGAKALGLEDSFEYALGVAALQEYEERNRAAGVDVGDLVPSAVAPGAREAGVPDVDAGVYEANAGDLFAARLMDFEHFSSSRRSLRAFDFDPLPLDTAELGPVVELAQNAPSACNRQSTLVRAVMDPGEIAKVSRLQGGSTGFGDRSSALLLVLSDLSLYDAVERRLPYVDGGLFAMNLLYALHYHGLGACILNASFTEASERELRDLLGIGRLLVPVALIAVAKVPEDARFKVANAPRRPIESVLRLK